MSCELRHMSLILGVWYFTAKLLEICVFCCVTLCYSAWCVLLCDTVLFSMVCSVVWHCVIQCVVANISKDWSVFIFRVMQSTKNVSFLVRFTLMKAHLKRLETSILDTVQKPFVKLHPCDCFVFGIEPLWVLDTN